MVKDAEPVNGKEDAKLEGKYNGVCRFPLTMIFLQFYPLHMLRQKRHSNLD